MAVKKEEKTEVVNEKTVLALRDAAIVSGFTFFSTLAGVSIASENVTLALYGACISTGIAFFSSLMTSLNIRNPIISNGK